MLKQVPRTAWRRGSGLKVIHNRKVVACAAVSPRDSRGAGITEAAAFLVFFSVFFVSAVVLFLDASILGLNKFKLGCITDSAAEYVATEVYFEGAANANFAGANLQQKSKVLVGSD